MTHIEIALLNRRFFRACTGGLTGKTALVELAVAGDVVRGPVADDLIRARALRLCPSEPLYGIAESDWPTAFLESGIAADDDPQLRWLGEWLVALTVAVQRWARDPVWRGRVLEAGPGRMSLAISWYRESVFDVALDLALRILPGWLSSEQVWQDEPGWLTWLTTDRTAVQQDSLERHIDGRWADIQAGGLGPNTLRFIEAAVRRGMPFDVLPSFVQIGWGANAERFDLATTGRTSWIAKTMAKNKVKTSQMLAGQAVPVPRARVVGSAEQAQRAADEIGWPVVVKPVNQDGGLGVVPGITDPDGLAWAFDRADRLSPGAVLVERHVAGDDHRMLVVRDRVLQVARRRAAQVIGDGRRTVRQLLDHLNADPRRGTQRYSLLRLVNLDEDVLACLAEQGLDPESVPADGVAVRLARIANISAGGTAEDVTGVAHPDNTALAQRAARVIGLDIAGIDLLSPDISRSWREVGAAVCEVNAQPGFRPHWLADPARDLNGEILDILFGERPARIPTAAITGTNGKTTTSEMLHRIWTATGKCTGICTTARVRIGDETVSTDNLSGQPGARIILNDPGAQAAVFEMPRKGLIHFGHPCDRYDVAALLNVQDDHIGVDGIETLEQMAELKAEVLARATEAIVVNAEDPLCMAMRARAGTGRHILVARSPHIESVAEHLRRGGEAAFLDDRGGRPWIVLAAGEYLTELMPVHGVPATMNGLLPFNEINAVFAAALAWAQGIDLETIRGALGSFANTPEQNPGRYNFLEGLPFDVLVDYAHNPDGVRGVCSVAAGLPVTGRRLLCSLNVGNRHPGHFEVLAPVLAASFDEFVLGCDPVEVAKSPEYAGADPTATMVARSRRMLLQQGVDPERITVETDRAKAVRTVLDNAGPGDLVVLLADSAEAHRVIGRWRAGIESADP